MSIKLIEPNIKYKNQIEEVKNELISLGKINDSDDWYLELNNIEEYVKQSKDKRAGINLKPGRVPSSIYWIINNQDRYIGRITLRHELTEMTIRNCGHIGYDIRPSERRKGYASKALELVLAEARKMSLGKVLLTCDESNAASRKVILKNGGKFQDKIDNCLDSKELTERYWINL